MKPRSWCSPGHFALLVLAGWLNREQQQVVETQKAEMRILREMSGHGHPSALRATLLRSGVEPVCLPRKSPTLNAFVERFIRSIREGCRDRVISLGETHRRELLRDYVAHYHGERPHQGLGGAIIEPDNDNQGHGAIVRRQRLGGLLNYDQRQAA